MNREALWVSLKNPKFVVMRAMILGPSGNVFLDIEDDQIVFGQLKGKVGANCWLTLDSGYENGKAALDFNSDGGFEM
jgi:hypothetical protein